MGKQNSKLKPEVLEDLKQNTEFTGKDYLNGLDIPTIILTSDYLQTQKFKNGTKVSWKTVPVVIYP